MKDNHLETFPLEYQTSISTLHNLLTVECCLKFVIVSETYIWCGLYIWMSFVFETWLTLLFPLHTVQSVTSVTQLCPTLCDCWTAACQASLSITNSQSLLKLMCIESMMLSNHLILCHPLLLLPSSLSQNQSLFQWVSSSHQVSKVLEFQFQHQSF